jgi:phenylpropionate dioxygenase-like ring-hydroxylating dioxygenase large terminal subunit
MTELAERPTAITGYDTSNVLYRVMDRLLLPAERYYDEAFFEAEKEIWMHVWQFACHGTEIPNPGDFTEYKILDQSVMLIRQTDGTVKGFYNACRHRGTALACGTGTHRSGQVVCPFHGWRWNLDGTNSYVYTKKGFRPDTVEQAEVDLPEVSVGLKWGFVWVNFDPDAIPFEENWHGVGRALDPHGFEKMHVNWWHQIEFAANWKIAQEAFFEAYHVMQTHPELALFQRDDFYPPLGNYASVPEQGHSWMAAAMETADSQEWIAPAEKEAPSDAEPNGPITQSDPAGFVATLTTMWQGSRSVTNERQAEIAEEVIKAVPNDEFYEEFFRRVYDDAAARNVHIPPPDPEMTGHWTAFPNFTGIVSLGCSMTYRVRPHPTDPNKCIFDFWALEIPPEGTPVTRPQIAADDAPVWDDLWFLQQDASNIERMQTGIRARGHKYQRIAPDLEKMIVNWHQVLDQHLAKYAK